MLLVQKYGGTSLADAGRIRAAARRSAELSRQGNQMVIVVSAQGDTTDEMIRRASQLNRRRAVREMDAYLAAGEQMSAALMAMAIGAMGCPAVSLTGWQAGMTTNANYGIARLAKINTERLELELGKRNIVVVAGFQGINKYDDITTLGRGGSDTSAVALAAALGADVCEIYTDVDGVYTTDPRIVKTAAKLDEISYDEMLELASLGANVLNNRSVEMAKKYNVKLMVLSSLHKASGTIVKEVSNVEKMLVRGVTRDNDTARISLIEVEDTPGKAFQTFSLLAKHNINVDLIIQSVGRSGTKDISFTVAESNLDDALKVLKDNEAVIGAKDIVWDSNVSKVSIVGAGMVTNPGVASGMFEALYKAHINIHMIATSEIKVSVLIDRKDAEKAVVAIHDQFDMSNIK